MNILMHTVYYAPEVGGLESHVHFLCRALAARGHTVRVVTSASLPGLPAFETMDGVELRRTWLPARNTPGCLEAGQHLLGEEALVLAGDVVGHAAIGERGEEAAAARPLDIGDHAVHHLVRRAPDLEVGEEAHEGVDAVLVDVAGERAVILVAGMSARPSLWNS